MAGSGQYYIMANGVDPADPQLQTWLAEGLSIEVHTLAHPCPCLGTMSLNILRPQAPVMLDDWKAALDQWGKFIDYAERTYGGRIKFLNFREAHERIAKAVPPGERLVDLDGDGLLEGVVPQGKFGIVRDGAVSMIAKDSAWTWKNGVWEPDPAGPRGHLFARFRSGRRM